MPTAERLDDLLKFKVPFKLKYVSIQTVIFVLLFQKITANVSFEFNKTTVGAVFEPYTKFHSIRNDYSMTEVISMLEIVSEKFQMISTYGIGAWDEGKRWNESNAAGLTPVAAAKVNQNLTKLAITVNSGIWKHNNDPSFRQEIQNAFDSAAEANKIFKGTVTGIIMTSHYSDLDDLSILISQNRNRSHEQGLMIGIRSSDCETISVSQAIGIGNQIIKEIDFIVCHLLPKLGNTMSESVITVGKSFLKYRDNFVIVNPNIKIYGETGWPSNDQQSINNMKEFWFHMNKWSTSNNFSVYLFSAFDEPWKITRGTYEPHYGWWKRIKNDSSNADAFIEKIQYIEPGQSHAMYIVFGIMGAIVVIGLVSGMVFLYMKLQDVKGQLLSKADIEEFEKGTPADKSNDGMTVTEDALRLPYDRSFEIPRTKFAIDQDRVLGSGAFGTVYKGKITDKDEDVAFKMTQPNCSATNLKSLLSEIKIMIHVGKHPNVVSILGAYTGEMRQGMIIIATEMCDMGSLEKYLRDKKSLSYANERLDNNDTVRYANDPTVANKGQADLTLSKLLKWSYHIACGMEHIASKNVIHSDLATRNVLLTSDETAKITDFGLSRRLYEYANYVKQNQEPLPWRWMAIESLKHMEFSTKSDVWSYGTTLWEIFSLGDVPWPGMAWTVDFSQELQKGLRMSQPQLATPETYKIMIDCWNLDPSNRPDFKSIKQFFQGLLYETPEYCALKDFSKSSTRK